MNETPAHQGKTVTCANPLAQVGARWRISNKLLQYQCAHTPLKQGANRELKRDCDVRHGTGASWRKLAHVSRGGGWEVRHHPTPERGWWRTSPQPPPLRIRPTHNLAKGENP